MTAIVGSRAIRGPVTAVPMVGKDGIKIEANTSTNQVEVKLDETVLFSGEHLANKNTVINLAESALNFDTLRIYASRIPASNAATYTDYQTTPGLNLSVYRLIFNADTTDVIIDMFRCVLSDDGNQLTINLTVRKVMSNNAIATGTAAYPMTITKVVGIGRKSL